MELKIEAMGSQASCGGPPPLLLPFDLRAAAAEAEARKPAEHSCWHWWL